MPAGYCMIMIVMTMMKILIGGRGMRAGARGRGSRAEDRGKAIPQYFIYSLFQVTPDNFR